MGPTTYKNYIVMRKGMGQQHIQTIYGVMRKVMGQQHIKTI